MKLRLQPITDGPSIALNRDMVMIGRAPTCEAVINDSALISSQHCRVLRKNGGVYVQDLDSTNGVHLNGRRIVAAELKVGDVLRIGDREFVLEKFAVDRWSKTDLPDVPAAEKKHAAAYEFPLDSHSVVDSPPSAPPAPVWLQKARQQKHSAPDVVAELPNPNPVQPSEPIRDAEPVPVVERDELTPRPVGDERIGPVADQQPAEPSSEVQRVQPVDHSAVDLPTVEKPTVEKPTVDLPTVDLSTVEKPNQNVAAQTLAEVDLTFIHNDGRPVESESTWESLSTDKFPAIGDEDVLLEPSSAEIGILGEARAPGLLTESPPVGRENGEDDLFEFDDKPTDGDSADDLFEVWGDAAETFAPEEKETKNRKSKLAPESWLDLDVLANMEKKAATVTSMAFECQECGEEFVDFAKTKKPSRKQTDNKIQYTAKCPECGSVAIATGKAQLQPGDPTQEAQGVSANYLPGSIGHTGGKKIRAKGAWGELSDLLNDLFVVGIVNTFLVMGFLGTAVWRSFGQKLAIAGGTFIPFSGYETTELKGAELVSTGVAMVLSGAAPLIVIGVIRYIAEELTMVAVCAALYGAITAWMIWGGGVISPALYYRAGAILLIIGVVAVLVCWVRCRVVPTETLLRGRVQSASFVLLLFLGLFGAVVFRPTSDFEFVEDSFSLPISGLYLCSMVAIGTIAQYQFATVLQGIARKAGDEQVVRSVNEYIIYLAVSVVVGLACLLVLLSGAFDMWPGYLLLLAGILGVVNVAWFFQICGFVRYCIR